MGTRVIAYTIESQDGELVITESTGVTLKSNNLQELLTFLTEQYDDYENPNNITLRVTWDVDDAFASLFRLLGHEVCRQLWDTKECDVGKYHFFYVPGKLLSINRRFSFYHLAQYFPDEEYQTDVEQIEMYGRLVIETLHKMGLYPKKLTSPPKIFEEWVLDHTNLPTAWDMPDEAVEWAYRTAGRLWIECFKVGRFNDTYDFDIRSAFPNVAAQLQDFRGCDWIESPEYQPKSVYGYVNGDVTIFPEVMVSPIIHIDDNGNSSSRTGTWPDYLSKKEIFFIYKWKIGKVKIERGLWAIPKQTKRPLVKPFENIVPRLLAQREKGRLENLLAKKMSTGTIYGKTLEEHEGEFGKHFNPVFGSEISTIPRLQVADFLYRHGIGPTKNANYLSLIYVAVDGTLLTSPVELTETEANWKSAQSGEAVALSSNQVWYGDKHPQGLYLKDVLSLIKTHPRTSRYQKKFKRRVTLGQVLESGKWDDLGSERYMTTSIDLRLNEPDRNFPKLPRTGQELLSTVYDSIPLTINHK